MINDTTNTKHRETMNYTSKDDIVFQKQLNEFEAAMQDDLNQRCEDAGQKWDFDFTTEKPMEEP